MTPEVPGEGHVGYSEYGVPIRNVWHMLLYAWNETTLKPPVSSSELESAPKLDALFALVLVRTMTQRMRIGLGRAYVNEEKRMRGVRGRVNFTESLKQQAFEKGEAVSDFQQYSANEPRNQILRSVMQRLVQVGEFGPDKAESRTLRQQLRWLVRNLDGIEFIEPTPQLISRHLAAENDHDYRLMLAVCELIARRQMPLERDGVHLQPGLDRDALLLHRIYERFVAGFYRLHLLEWEVSAQHRLDWHADETNEHLPVMIPDLTMRHKSTGKILLIDTKYTAGGLVENQWGKPIYDSSHLYQLYAYLRSQEHLSPAHRIASGILLYPAAKYRFSETIQLQDHAIRLECVDLAAPWQDVEQQLLDLVNESGG